MNDADRFRLCFGPYRTPRFQYGKIVWCEVRGEVRLLVAFLLACNAVWWATP